MRGQPTKGKAILGFALVLQRILGDGEFVQSVLSQMDDLGKENFTLATRRLDLPTLADKVCNVHGILLGELGSGSRRHEILEARRILSWLAVKELGYRGAKVARYLRVTTLCVDRAVSSGQRPKRETYI